MTQCPTGILIITGNGKEYDASILEVEIALSWRAQWGLPILLWEEVYIDIDKWQEATERAVNQFARAARQ